MRRGGEKEERRGMYGRGDRSKVEDRGMDGEGGEEVIGVGGKKRKEKNREGRPILTVGSERRLVRRRGRKKKGNKDGGEGKGRDGQ